MTALSAATNSRQRRGIGRYALYPVASGVTIYKGGLVSISAGGYAIPAADTASTTFAGLCVGGRDNDMVSGAITATSNGSHWVVVEDDITVLFTATSITQAMVNTSLVIVDDNTVDDAAGATNDIVLGSLEEFVSSTSGWVHLKRSGV